MCRLLQNRLIRFHFVNWHFALHCSKVLGQILLRVDEFIAGTGLMLLSIAVDLADQLAVHLIGHRHRQPTCLLQTQRLSLEELNFVLLNALSAVCSVHRMIHRLGLIQSHAHMLVLLLWQRTVCLSALVLLGRNTLLSV